MVGRLCVLLLPLCLVHASARADMTVPGGMQVRSATWEGTVIVDGVAEYDAGTTLTILPGTVVRFAAPRVKGAALSALVVHGTLQALGTAERPIRLVPATGDGPEAWEGLRIAPSSGPPSRLEHCVVTGARTGIAGERARLEAANLVIRGNRTGIRGRDGFRLRLSRSLLTDNQRGIEFEQNAEALLEGNRITGNGEAGIYCRGSSPHITGNAIENNGEVGIACLNGSSPEISDNRIEGQRTGIAIVKMSSPVVSYNAILHNDTGIRVERRTASVIERNRINDNHIGIFCNYAAYPRVHDNNLQDNTQFAIALGRQQSIEISRRGPLEERGGVFAARAGPMQLRQMDRVAGAHPEIPAAGIIPAQNNWWGAPATAEMAVLGREADIDAISDYHDGATVEYEGRTYPRDRVGYVPWRETAVVDCGPRGGESFLTTLQ